MHPPAARARHLGRVAFAVLLACLAGTTASAVPRPSFVVVVTDDQRFDTLWAMPHVQAELIARGTDFRDAFVTTPLCCPFRASFLSGGFPAHSTGVLWNDAPIGGAARFADAVTLATRLQQAGYTTALLGKYLNGYEQIAPRVPPGWSVWEGALGLPMLPIPYVIGSSGAQAEVGVVGPVVTQDQTEHLRDRALAFLDAQRGDPFFLFLAFGAPHGPALAAPQDQALFDDFLHRGRAWNEPDPSDKPARVQAAQAAYAEIAAQEDVFHRAQLRSLQGVDRAVRDVVQRIAQRGWLQRTWIVFTSDNGLLWGEHGLVGKSEAYEESVRVPLVVVQPGGTPRTDHRLVAVNLDVPATIADAAGLAPAGEGVSLLPLLADPALPARAETLIEQAQPQRVWSGLRVRDASGDWKYVEDTRGDVELYDLAADPYEEHNLAADPAHAARRAELAARLAPRKGLAIRTHALPPAAVGEPYAVALERWGGAPPFVWSVDAPGLPPGLALDPDTGTLSGVATERGAAAFVVRVTDASTGMQSGGPQSYAQALVLSMPGRCENGLDDDGDGAVDGADPGCAGASDPDERSALACDNGLDDDGDGRADVADPGCGAPSGTTESPACDDGFDNDGDGRVDLADPDCVTASGADEALPPACSNGADDDGDGHVDLLDPGCAGSADDAETSERACDNGADDDGDGRVDVADPGCAGPAGTREDPRCQNGADDDGDGRVDFDGGASLHGGVPIAPADPDCGTASESAEAHRCGVGAELVLLVALLRRARRAVVRRARSPQITAPARSTPR
ncbi:MAG: hypothetical protein DCC71_23115 [Proteobacteria bacterium]|nr:MAG: hypothetical protein DCC71_23115 [Pseudomonadota bacterium]